MMRDNKDIIKDVKAIDKMSEGAERLGFAIDNAVREVDNSYYDMGRYLLGLVRDYPDQAGIIEQTVIAICGFGFDSLKEHMKEEREDYLSL